jgi:hypothetical protein
MHRGCQGMTPSCGRIYLNKKGLCGDKFGIVPRDCKEISEAESFWGFWGRLDNFEPSARNGDTL